MGGAEAAVSLFAHMRASGLSGGIPPRARGSL